MNRFRPFAWCLTCVTVCVMLVSCASESNRMESLDNAQIAIENSDYRMARSICDDVLAKENKSDTKDAELMARLSLLYMKLADHNDMTDRDENIDYAYECYEQAFNIDSLEAINYFKSLSVEDMPQVALLESIVKNAKVHPDSIISDSIAPDFPEIEESL